MTGARWLIALAAVLAGQGAGTATPLAFPGADGFGKHATGWRGGEVMAVTSLQGDGPGSLRACATNEDKPRICIFQVAGTILLDRPIRLGSNLYIAGQTAPGAGIQLRNRLSHRTPLIVKNAHDVVIRFLKLRPGPSQMPSAAVDAITLENARRVYLGNLSMAFATDETFNVHVSGTEASDITLADSILALSLDRSTHPKGRHSKGALICSSEGQNNACGRITLLRNLVAHHRDRNPDVKGTGLGPIEVINNIFYNPISQFGEFYDHLGDLHIAYVGNLALRGPSSVRRVGAAMDVFAPTDGAQVTLFARDNVATTATGCTPRTVPLLSASANDALSPSAWPLSASVMPVAGLVNTLLPRVGDHPPQRARDALDTRVVADVTACTGQVIDHPDQVGGWPTLPETHAAPDQDNDLFPDAWEKITPGLDPTTPDAPWQPLPSGAGSAVEHWLATLAGDLL